MIRKAAGNWRCSAPGDDWIYRAIYRRIEYEEPFVYVDDKRIDHMKASSTHTGVFNALGNPVVTMPIGFSEDDLPIGVQVVGSRLRDADLLVVADQLFKVGGVLKHPPGYGLSE